MGDSLCRKEIFGANDSPSVRARKFTKMRM
jgi:hypothetical protein